MEKLLQRKTCFEEQKNDISMKDSATYSKEV